jgi:hypothetical protein
MSNTKRACALIVPGKYSHSGDLYAYRGEESRGCLDKFSEWAYYEVRVRFRQPILAFSL